MSTHAKYEHLLLHCSILQYHVGSLYEENPGLEHDALIQSITRELQWVLAACRVFPFDKTVPKSIFGPPVLFRFSSVLPSPPLSPPAPVLVSLVVFPPNAAELLFLPDNNLLVMPPFISSPSLFCSDLGGLSFYYSCIPLLILFFLNFSHSVGWRPRTTALLAWYFGDA